MKIEFEIGMLVACLDDGEWKIGIIDYAPTNNYPDFRVRTFFPQDEDLFEIKEENLFFLAQAFMEDEAEVTKKLLCGVILSLLAKLEKFAPVRAI